MIPRDIRPSDIAFFTSSSCIKRLQKIYRITYRFIITGMQLCKQVKQKKHAIAANLTIDLMSRHVTRSQRAIILTPREFLLLDFFARFFRAEAAAGTHGHGLGLSIARELALAQGGDALYRRFVSGWTHFTLEFPVG